MSTEIKNHRLGAFVYGFMSGLGLVLIIWGLATIVALPSSSSSMSIGIILLGVLLFAMGSCREAYIRGSLSLPLSQHKGISTIRNRSSARNSDQLAHQGTTNSSPTVTEQVNDHSVEMGHRETVVYEEKHQTQT
ncbi:MAG: hypothetical protein JSV51_05830 [Candidatus Bathyarchaeota archaeon]|nr:MAG: hypothetical protein JSV51_05830 [Candidatus Bathyarchaeota archaeon]